MRLSKRSQYGLRAAIQLAACYEDGYVQTHEISRRESLPTKFLESILRSMKSAGLLISKVGAAGGYRLASRPETISVGAVLNVLEGQVFGAELGPLPAEISRAERGRLGVHLVVRRVRMAIDGAIDSLTLTDLLEEVGRVQNKSQSMYYI